MIYTKPCCAGRLNRFIGTGTGLERSNYALAARYRLRFNEWLRTFPKLAGLQESCVTLRGNAGSVRELLQEMKPVGTDQALVCCTYHAEKNTSMSINTASGLHNCRGCGKTGTVFDLVIAVVIAA